MALEDAFTAVRTALEGMAGVTTVSLFPKSPDAVNEANVKTPGAFPYVAIWFLRESLTFADHDVLHVVPQFERANVEVFVYVNTWADSPSLELIRWLKKIRDAVTVLSAGAARSAPDGFSAFVSESVTAYEPSGKWAVLDVTIQVAAYSKPSYP